MTLAGLRKCPAYFLYHFFWKALDWVFPPNCAGCNQLGERWCSSCRSTIAPVPEPLCSRCGSPLRQNGQTDGLCQDCVAVPPAFTALRSTCIYRSGARKAVLRLKYGRDIGLGEALAAQMAAQISNLQWPVELVTCVPLSAGRRSQRGYNQAAALARPLALGMNLPFRPLLLRKKREVPSQVGLSFEERRLNVQDAFETGGSIQIGKNVLVVDDVTTTGSTMNACARALIDAGAQRVYGLTFARAGLSDHNQSEQARN